MYLCISTYSVRMQENAGKNVDQNNSEYGLFLRSDWFLLLNPLSDESQLIKECKGK